MTRHAESFSHETSKLVRKQMMHKQGGSDDVKAGIAKRQRQSVAANSLMAAVQMCYRTVHHDWMDNNSRAAERGLGQGRDITGAAGHVQPVQLFKAPLLRHLAQQSAHGAHATEEAIEHPQVSQRIGYFLWRPAVRVEQLGHHQALHR